MALMASQKDKFINNMPSSGWCDGLTNGVEKSRNGFKAKRHTSMWAISKDEFKTNLRVAINTEEMKVLKNMVISVATLLS